YQSTTEFRGLVCFRDLACSDYSVVACFQPLVAPRHCSHPFHSEILQSQKQSPKVVTCSSTSYEENNRRSVSEISARINDTEIRRAYGKMGASLPQIARRKHAHGLSCCQHVGADNMGRLLVSDFMGRFQMRP